MLGQMPFLLRVSIPEVRGLGTISALFPDLSNLRMTKWRLLRTLLRNATVGLI